MESLDCVAAHVAASLPETVKRDILARLLSPDNAVVLPLGSDRPATVQSATVLPQSVQPGQARSIRHRQLVVPSLDAGAAIVDGVLSQQEVQVRSVQALLRHPFGAELSKGMLIKLPFQDALSCACLWSRTPQAVAAAAEAWLSRHGRQPGMGSSSSGGLWHDPSFRGDINCWVTPAELEAAEQPLLAACLEMLLGLRPQLAAQG